MVQAVPSTMRSGGGTDASPALIKSLKMLEDAEKGYKNADVLMISDFVMDGIDGGLAQRIEAQRKEKTRFFSLVIGTSGNGAAIKCFDENWEYNTNAAGQMRRIVRSMKDAALC